MGSDNVRGYGPVELIAAKINQGGKRSGNKALNKAYGSYDNEIVASMNSRTYLGDGCVEGAYANVEYGSWKLLGKTLSYEVDLSKAGCGCNAALYLTSMRQNDRPSDCSDYYCDANSVCGVACAEIDMMEANTRAFHATLHARDDHAGVEIGRASCRERV